MSRKGKTPVLGPMSHLEELVHKAGLRLKGDAPPAPEPSKPIPAPPKQEVSEEELFTEAMGGVDLGFMENAGAAVFAASSFTCARPGT